MRPKPPSADGLRYTVSGPGIDKSYADLGPAISRATTAANKHQGVATFYVRDADETVIARVERDEHGHLFIYQVPRAKAAA